MSSQNDEFEQQAPVISYQQLRRSLAPFVIHLGRYGSRWQPPRLSPEDVPTLHLPTSTSLGEVGTPLSIGNTLLNSISITEEEWLFDYT